MSLLQPKTQLSPPQTPPIERLSVDLILLILERLPFESHFDFALTSRRIHNNARSILERHQLAHRRYRAASDLDPLMVPRLVEAALDGAIEAWHVRSFEIWRERWTWDDWREFGSRELVDKSDGQPPVRDKYSLGEIDRYLRVLREELHVSEKHIAQLPQSGYEVGNDTLLKVLLIALCPRIETLRIVRGNERDERSKLLGSLALAIWDCQLAAQGWPPGFAALKNVEIGVASSNESSQEDDNHPTNSSAAIMPPIFMLPSIKWLYFRHFGANEDDGNDVDYYEDEGIADGSEEAGDDDESEEDDGIEFPPPGSSTLEHIFIDGDPNMEIDAFEALLAAPAALKSLSVRGNDNGTRLEATDEIVQFACQSQPGLETLMMYLPSGLSGYQSVVFHPDKENVADHMKLRHLTVTMRDWVTRAYYLHEADGQSRAFFEKWATEQEWCVTAAAMALPQTLEVLVVGDQRAALRRLIKDEADRVEGCLTHLITSGELPQLRLIAVQEPEPDEQCEWRHSWVTLREVGREHGVEVWVGCNSRPITHPMDLPKPPCPRSLASTSLRDTDEDAKWGFNVFSGCMQLSGIGS